jgi:exodeoxyribonuclease V alpha subunit
MLTPLEIYVNSMRLEDHIRSANLTGSTAIKIMGRVAEINEPHLKQLGDLCGYINDFKTEKAIILELNRLKSFGRCWIAPSMSCDLDAEQNHAVSQFFNSNILLLTGSAGSGKTKVICKIVQILISAGIQAEQIALISPLGVIANRLSIKTGIPAFTVNRILEFKQDEGTDENPEYKPIRNSTNPLNQDFFIVDESTLLTNELFYCLLAAIRKGSRLLLAGDIKQLLGVGKGQVFNDLVESQERTKSIYSVVDLKNNYRNNGTSIESYTRFLANFTSDQTTDIKQFNSKNFKYIHTDSDLETVRLLEESLIKLKLINPTIISQVQILCPEHNGCVGTKDLNKLVRGIEGGNDGLGQRVMFTRNNYYKNIFNGQAAVIDSVLNDKTLLVSGGRIIGLNSENLWEYIEPAYALTPNRCQGAEFSLVIVIIPHSRTYINRSWLYACSTRAKQSLIVIGSELMLKSAIKKNNKRQTFISKLLMEFE